MSIPLSTPVLRVNQHGKRYSDEAFGTHILAALPGAHQPNGNLWAVFDDTIGEQITYQTPCHGLIDYTDEDEMKRLHTALEEAKQQKGKEVLDKNRAGEKRPLYCADRLEELAERMFEDEVDRQMFLKEVQRYNQLCKKGHDDDFGKDPRLMHPVEKAPFYASGTVKDSHKPGGQSLKILVTVSGLEIDEHQQVLNREFEPIPGLYATGTAVEDGLEYSIQHPCRDRASASPRRWDGNWGTIWRRRGAKTERYSRSFLSAEWSIEKVGSPFEIEGESKMKV